MRPEPILALLALAACDPYAGWPRMDHVFPWGVVDDQVLEPYEEVRWEAGPWDPEAEPENNGLYLQKALLHRTGAPSEVLYHWGLMRGRIPPLQPDQLTVSFAGDILDVGAPVPDFSAVAPIVDGDLRVANLETPVAPSVATEPGPLGVPRFNAPPELLDDLPFDVLQVVNNHTLDAGDAGIEETVAEIEARGMVPLGLDGAAAAWQLADGSLLALVAYTWGVNDPAATSAHDLGIVPFAGEGWADLRRIRDDLAALREAGVDLVVVLVHWGYEYEYHPDPRFLRIARRVVRYGADLVVGHGPHVAQPAEWCAVNIPGVRPGLGTCSLRTDDGIPRYAGIVYSLGNFASDQPTLPLQVGLVAHANLAPGVGVFGMGWEAVASVPGEDGLRVVPLDDLVDDPAYAEEAARLDQHLGTGWKRAR